MRIVRSDGLKWAVDDERPSGDMIGPEHEATVRNILLGLIPDGGVFLDVGAHVGHYSLRASRIASRVIAVEASKDAARVLNINLALNGITNVAVLNLAAWDQDERLVPFSPNRVDRDGSTRWRPGTGLADGVVPGMRLDVALLNEPRLDVVKVDAEGSDLHVLRGMSGLLERHRPLLFVEDHSMLGPDYYQQEELFSTLRSLGYTWRDSGTYSVSVYWIARRYSEG